MAKGTFRRCRRRPAAGRNHQAVPGFTAIEDLNLTIPAGSFFALLGPSGCGKTTTLRLVAGLEEPTAGRILIGGTDVTTTKPFQRPVNTVFQSYALFPHMTVLENVAFGLRRRRIADTVAVMNKGRRTGAAPARGPVPGPVLPDTADLATSTAPRTPCSGASLSRCCFPASSRPRCSRSR